MVRVCDLCVSWLTWIGFHWIVGDAGGPVVVAFAVRRVVAVYRHRLALIDYYNCLRWNLFCWHNSSKSWTHHSGSRLVHFYHLYHLSTDSQRDHRRHFRSDACPSVGVFRRHSSSRTLQAPYLWYSIVHVYLPVNIWDGRVCWVDRVIRQWNRRSTRRWHPSWNGWQPLSLSRSQRIRDARPRSTNDLAELQCRPRRRR